MVIVGAGDCGARGAFALREAGFAGPVTLVGEEPHLPYERPPLSKEALASDGEPRPKPVAAAEKFVEAGIECLVGRRAAAIDRAGHAVVLSDGSRLPYDRLLIATGAVPRRLSLHTADSRRCRYLRTVDDAVAINRHLKPGSRIVIIGGGFIGLELAAAARKRDAGCVLVEALPRILGRGVPADIAAVVEARHRREGVAFRLGAGLEAIEETADAVAVRLRGGEVLTADLVIVGIGAVPSTELAADSGLAVDNGVAVDEALATGDPDVFAAGDCCSFPLAIYGGRRVRLESWRNALDQGSIAARNMLGARQPIGTVPWNWSDQYDMTMQFAGLADEYATTVRRHLGTDAFLLFHLAADGRLVAASGIGPGNAVARDIRLAEMLIARRAHPPAADLASPATKLKSLLAA
jgi:3-phenylpropionate/trans-cinnamate dioxygenase ferredoxin reductase subunit